MARRGGDGFEPWVGDWIASLRSPNTRAAYQRDIDVFRAWLVGAGVHARDVTEEDVEEFADSCTDAGAAGSTVRRRVAAVASFYRYVATAWAMENPATDADRPPTPATREPVVLSPTDAAAFWRAALALGAKTAAVVGLVLHDGMKAHEVLRLDARDVRPAQGGMIVRRGAVGADEQPLDPRTAAVLRRYLAGRKDGPLLYGDSPTRAQARLTRHGVDYLVRRTAAHAELGVPVTVNVLRNTHSAER